MGKRAWKKFSKQEILNEIISECCKKVKKPSKPLNFATLGILMFGICKIYEYQVTFVLKTSNESYAKLIRFVSKRVEQQQNINLPTNELQAPQNDITLHQQRGIQIEIDDIADIDV